MSNSKKSPRKSRWRLLVLLVGYVVFLIRQSRAETQEVREEYASSVHRAGAWDEHWAVQVLLMAAGLGLLVAGSNWLVDSAVAELETEVRSLGERDAATHVARANDLVDLLELSGHHLPFDVPSLFARSLRALPPNARSLTVRLLDAPEDYMPKS